MSIILRISVFIGVKIKNKKVSARCAFDFETFDAIHIINFSWPKPKFLRKMADWIEQWTNQKVPKSQKFTLSPQTSKALIRTLRCQAQLIEELLEDGYEYVLTARFQSDPLERRFGQYRQMSGGRFLVSLKDTVHSEKILKIKSLLKAGCDLDDSVREEKPSVSNEQLLLNNPRISEIFVNMI